jgi:hypothetical protein
MVLSYEARVALLEKARAAKAAKRAGLNQVRDEDAESAPTPAPVKKSRAKSVKPKQPSQGRTLELPKTPEPLSDEEPEVEERIVYRPKPSKKKKIIRTIIKDPSDDDEDEEEIHETVEQPPKPKKQIPATQPKLCPSKSSFFCY